MPITTPYFTGKKIMYNKYAAPVSSYLSKRLLFADCRGRSFNQSENSMGVKVKKACDFCGYWAYFVLGTPAIFYSFDVLGQSI